MKKVNQTLAAKKKELKKKEGELVENTIYYAMKTTSELMKEFKDRKADTWEPDQAFKEYA